MVEIFKTQQLEVALDVYKIWLDRSIKFGFYQSSVALTFDGQQWAILVVTSLNQTYLSTMPF